MKISRHSMIRVMAAFALASASTLAGAADVVVDGRGEIPYVIDGRSVVTRSGTDLCWRTGYWTPAAAASAQAGPAPVGCACDPDVVPKEKCLPPMAAAPAAAPAAPAPVSKMITLSAKALFEFDKAVLKPAGKAAIDTDVLGQLAKMKDITLITISGHADRLGSAQYNQALSEKRATAVKSYLIAKGVNADLIDTYGFGKTQPVPGVKCDDALGRKKLIECLEPNRRVVIEVKGNP